MSKKTTLIQRVRSYLNTRKTPATIEQVMRGAKVQNPESSVARTLRLLVENGEAINTVQGRGRNHKAAYILTR